MRGIDRDLIRGGHYGERSCEPHQKAEHMAAPTTAAHVKKTLANPEPSTHGPTWTEGSASTIGGHWVSADLPWSFERQGSIARSGTMLRCSEWNNGAVSRAAAARRLLLYHTLGPPCCPIYPRHPYLPKRAEGPGNAGQPLRRSTDDPTAR
jgi:hypothetical protein